MRRAVAGQAALLIQTQTMIKDCADWTRAISPFSCAAAEAEYGDDALRLGPVVDQAAGCDASHSVQSY